MEELTDAVRHALKILFLSQRVPYPPNRGDKITTWRLIERMSREHEVHCIAFAHDEADERAAEELRSKGFAITTIPYSDKAAKLKSLPLLLTRTPLTLGVYGSRALQAEVDKLLPSCDMAYAYSSSMGAFFLKHENKPRVMHFGELDSDKWHQYSKKASWPMSWIYHREYRTLFKFETELANSVDQNVFCTPLEEEIFHQRIVGPPATVLRNGVDLKAFAPDPAASEPGHLAFSGVMNYHPNVDGCVHFVQEVLPRVREEFPETRFTIIGSQPTAEILKLGETRGVEVTGFVDDTRDYLCRAAISVAPLRIARGIQNKVLEAMAMGLPVVGTVCATQGVNAEHQRDYIVAESAEEQAIAIRGLLRAPDEAAALGVRARRFVEQNYDWEVVFSHLDKIIEECVSTENATA